MAGRPLVNGDEDGKDEDANESRKGLKELDEKRDEKVLLFLLSWKSLFWLDWLIPQGRKFWSGLEREREFEERKVCFFDKRVIKMSDGV